MAAVSERWIFRGHIAGVGSLSGIRAVVGIWDESPFGAFSDAMVELPSGRRLLLAPRQEIADFIKATYSFEEVRLTPVRTHWGRSPDGGGSLSVDAGPLQLRANFGRSTGVGRLLALVPRALAVRPAWLTLVSPLASVLSPGIRTAGTAAPGRREFYGVTGLRSIDGASIYWEGRDAGALADIAPAVRFGFSSVPGKPTLATVQTTIVAAVHVLGAADFA